MTNNNHKLGVFAYNKGLSAEKIACHYLIKNKWEILHKRFRCPLGEIDLIVKKENWLVFVEVKARKQMHDAIAAISLHQKQRLYNTAAYYLEIYQLQIENARFDLIAIDQSGQIEHFENIILTEY